MWLCVRTYYQVLVVWRWVLLQLKSTITHMQMRGKAENVRNSEPIYLLSTSEILFVFVMYVCQHCKCSISRNNSVNVFSDECCVAKLDTLNALGIHGC